MRTGLGRGLDVLLGPAPKTADAPLPVAPAAVTEIPLEGVVPNPQQPRKQFDADGLNELAESIRRHGVLQPIVVSRRGEGFELIAGHRRVLASRVAGKTSIPAVIREDITDRLELALVENVQRADLDPLDEARAYKLLMETYGLTQDQVGQRVGKHRVTITNALRSLEAPQFLQDAVVDGKISGAHLRALLGLPEALQRTALAQVIARGYTAHQTEQLARDLRESGDAKPKVRRKRAARAIDPETRSLMNELRAALGTKVEIDKKRKGGRITIDFYSNEEFERLYELLTRGAK